MTADGPRFPARLALPLINLRSGLPYTLVRADTLEPTPERLAEIVAANNEQAVYRWLWRDRLEGRPYAPEDAQRFLAWAADGWREGTHFVFAVLTADQPERAAERPGGAGELAAALDIKSPELGGAGLPGAEVGYWQRAAHGGSMTPALTALAGLARDAGYRSLSALVNPGNDRSAAVLTRSGFAEVAGEERAGERLRKFRRKV